MTTIIVGSGPVGLGAARAIASNGLDVLVIDRIPVIGGMNGWEDRSMQALAAEAAAVGARFALGATACRWEAGRGLLIAGPAGVQTIRAEHLLFCGGRRPATVAELCIGGDRPAGVVASSVAKHLLESGEALWREPVVLGAGYDGDAVARMLANVGANATRIGSGEGSLGQARIQRIVGRPRVQQVVVDCAGTSFEVFCDAVILAADDRPVRNVVGAITDDATGVTYIQPAMSIPTTEAVAESARIAIDVVAPQHPIPVVSIKEQTP
ncbi:MAG: NAD(P)-binding protein [Thermoleophilia bacterium]